MESPAGSDQKISGTIARKPVNDNVLPQFFQAANDQADIIVKFIHRKRLLFIKLTQIRMMKDVEKGKFQAVHREAV